jgi:hypothetical protein
MIAEIRARMVANTKEMNAKTDANQAKADGKQKEMQARMGEDIKSNQAERRSTMCAIRSVSKETLRHEMKAVIQPIRSNVDEKIAYSEATETKPDPRLMQSTEEHQKIPKGEVAVIPVGEPRKRRRVCNKRKVRTRGNCGSGGSRLLPAGRPPVVQKWHGGKGNPSGKLGSRKTVNSGRNWPSHPQR